MSGQPYKYYTDVEKYRNEYLDTLNLQTNINDMNLQANKTYKETGALPAVSQMKDSRTTSEILADTEKLKIDVIQSLSKISNPQFASAVVQYILNSPINQDNRLLIFTAQRINDISDKLSKIYRYGIKGDQNDIQQFVNFVISMYNDKNAIASSTKDFLVKYGSSNLGQFSGTRTDAYTSLSNTLATLYDKLHIIQQRITSYENEIKNDKAIHTNMDHIVRTIASIIALIRYINKLIPSNTTLDKVYHIIQQLSIYDNLSNTEDGKTLISYLDYINSGLPNVSNISLTNNKIDIYADVYIKYIIELVNILHKSRYTTDEQLKTYVINANNLDNALINLLSILTPNELYTDKTIHKLAQDLDYIISDNYVVDNSYQLDPDDESKDDTTSGKKELPEHLQDIGNQLNIGRLKNAYELVDDNSNEYDVIGNDGKKYRRIRDTKDLVNEDYGKQNPLESIEYEHFEPIPKEHLNIPQRPDRRARLLKQIINSSQNLNMGQRAQLLQETDDNVLHAQNNKDGIRAYQHILFKIHNPAFIDMNTPQSPHANNLEDPFAFDDLLNIGGNGIRKRGRPKGSGIQRKYADTVKRSIIDGKGIQEDMRFIKFGKYLINNKKLNDGILAVKRPSGNNILEFPSQRISKNMQNVIKTMVGGGMPKYEQFECLSEPEKAYLHKLSSKANILDKFSIPAPSKSQYEKDIHDFEVMKGEIMSGNDNKDLIKKFKLHIMKLSKMGSLPKHDVSDILETLIQLGY